MAYTKKTWKNSETRLSAENLNTIENGLEAAATKADEATAKAAANTNTINGHTTAINGLTTSLNGLTTTVNNNKTDANSKFTSVENRIAAVEQINGTQNSTISTLGTEIIRVEGKFDSSVASLTSGQSTTNTNLNNHKNAKNNPHEVTAAQVGAYSKDEINIINSAAILQCPTMMFDDITRDYSYTISDISRAPQKLLINTSKPGGDSYDVDHYYAGEGENGLWSLTYTDDEVIGLLVNGDFEDFGTLLSAAGYTYDLIKKDINNENIIDYNNGSASTQIPSNYLSTMKCMLPAHIHGSTGFSTSGSHDSAAGCFASLIFESPSQKKLYIVPCGINNSLYERLIFHIVDDRYLLIKGNYVYKRVVDLKAYGDDLIFYSIGFNNISSSGSVSMYSINVNYPTFALYTNTGETVISPKPLLSVGTYEIDLNPSVTAQGCDYFIYYFENPNTTIDINNSIQYARDNSNLVSLGRNIPSSIDMDKLNRDVELKAQLAVKHLINVGTSDPNASTPGLLYFKYLP